MAHEQLTYADLLRIVELVKASEQFSEFRLKVGEIEIELRRRGPVATVAPGGALDPDAAAPGSATAASAVHSNAASGASRGAEELVHSAPPSSTAGAAASHAASPQLPEGATVVRSPMVGTFYRSPEPGAPAFVELGRHVEAATIVCIIEVMKLMNSIPAGARGTVAAILAADASPVDVGQPLIVLQPDAEPE